ncbi:ArsR family transcriptional regulator [Allgaiera indica]|uniref:ArsR family transcriptional regulator n=2 Tax=Allgaiera indica TaxID=765699 RepID=A0AAN4USE4_9RHOB|nr:ArsR family transcriptional regulator [Allgaiera indica]SDX22689.1 transcriptional regulator, ArsR family [Allgaiera indica]
MLIPHRLTTLGHPQRLALFRLLMRRYPDRLPAGEIAEALGVKANTLSNYLSALMQAGLITQHRDGRSLLYAIELGAVRETFDFLLHDCCRGRPDICAPISPLPGEAPAPAPEAGHKYNVLFICTGNSARSIFAETLLRDRAGNRFNAYSAGTRPHSSLNPLALEVMKAHGHDVSTLRAKNVAEVSGPGAPRFDFVFTVCNQAANEACPAWEGQPVSGHWGVPDPVKAEGSPAERRLAFHAAYGALKRRIDAFAALPFEALDRIGLQSAVDRIGRDDPPPEKDPS